MPFKPSIVCAILALFPATLPAQWKSAQGPLKTRWADRVKADAVLPEYPRPQMVRKDWLNLNGLWQLQIVEGKDLGAPPAGKDLPETILVPFCVESALSGVMKRAERLWYRRTFETPATWAGKRILLQFGAVDWEATVLVNGKALGSHKGGYDGFSFDITEALKASGPQEILVGVFDPTDGGEQPRGKQVRKPGGIFYTPVTGIWQTVWLEPVPEARITGIVLTPNIDTGSLRVLVQGTAAAQGLDAVATAREPGGAEIARIAGKPGTELSLAIAAAKLWSPESPFLYDLTVSLHKGTNVVDSVDSYFGMRKIEVASDGKVQRLMLNGKFVFQSGPLDQGFWPDGIYTAPTDEALRFDVEITRKLGFNASRKHVKVEPDRWYYWADKLGLLIWQDMPGSGNGTPASRAQFETELERMVLGFRNHPSIIIWVVFNEGWGQYDTERLTAWVKKLDPSRLANNASGWSDRKVGDMIDMHNYPGPGSPKPEEKRAAVLGEFGGLGLKVDGHTWQKETWGYQGMANPKQLTRRYLQLLDRAWKLKDDPGLSACIYTQITDVETECNGLLTYDREVVKPDLFLVAAANRGEFPDLPQVTVKTIAPTSQKAAQDWKYTLEKPGADWMQAGLDDSAWKSGKGGFGTRGTPGAVVGTEWRTGEIWIRRRFDWDGKVEGELKFLVHHDEDVEIHINGVLAAKAEGFTSDYEELEMSAEGRAALKEGGNILAVKCRQTSGGQFIDVGVISTKEEPRK